MSAIFKSVLLISLCSVALTFPVLQSHEVAPALLGSSPVPDVFVVFVYASYDGVARKFLPEWQELTNDLKADFEVGELEVKENDPEQRVQQKLGISVLPTLVLRMKYEDSENKVETLLFQGPWTKEAVLHFLKENAPRVCAMIPARYASTRFRGKMLKVILGKPMIQNTFEKVNSSQLVDAVWITTESDDLISAAKEFTHRIIKTSDIPINGMERIGEAEIHLPPSCKVLVNVHGDEPFVHPEHVDAVVQLYKDIVSRGNRDEIEKLGAATLRKKIKSEEEAMNRGYIKMVIRDDGKAMYLSRALIPHSKDGKFDPDFDYWYHVNLHAFARGFASKYRAFPNPKAQQREDVEYLRILFMGYDLVSTEIGDTERDVNTQEDYDYLVNKYGK